MMLTSLNQPPRAINEPYSRGLFRTERPASVPSVILQFLPMAPARPAEHVPMMLIYGGVGNSKTGVTPVLARSGTRAYCTLGLKVISKFGQLLWWKDGRWIDSA